MIIVLTKDEANPGAMGNKPTIAVVFSIYLLSLEISPVLNATSVLRTPMIDTTRSTAIGTTAISGCVMVAIAAPVAMVLIPERTQSMSQSLSIVAAPPEGAIATVGKPMITTFPLITTGLGLGVV